MSPLRHEVMRTSVDYTVNLKHGPTALQRTAHVAMWARRHISNTTALQRTAHVAMWARRHVSNTTALQRTAHVAMWARRHVSNTTALQRPGHVAMWARRHVSKTTALQRTAHVTMWAARQQNYNCLTSYRDDLENEPWMKVANRVNFCPMDKKQQEMGREERKTCGDEEGACIELESLGSVLVSIGNCRCKRLLTDEYLML